ncbi:MAG: hypothetical protein AAF638_03795 [Pseudomonadota bacterium]
MSDVPMSRLETRRADRREFRLVYALSFIFFLVIAVFARLLPRSRRPYPLGSGDYRSIVGEARAITNMTIPYAFMG